jgi:hypothetical protein
VLQTLNARLQEQGKDNRATSISGPEMFGFSIPTIAKVSGV